MPLMVECLKNCVFITLWKHKDFHTNCVDLTGVFKVRGRRLYKKVINLKLAMISGNVNQSEQRILCLITILTTKQ